MVPSDERVSMVLSISIRAILVFVEHSANWSRALAMCQDLVALLCVDPADARLRRAQRLVPEHARARLPVLHDARPLTFRQPFLRAECRRHSMSISHACGSSPRCTSAIPCTTSKAASCSS